MTGTAEKLGNFRVASEEDWRALIGREGIASLAKVSDDGIPLEPIHVAYRGHALPIQRTGGAWTIIQSIEHPDSRHAVAQVEAELAGGAGGLTFVFSGSAAAHRGGFGLRGNFAAIAMALPPLADLHLRLEGGFASYSDTDAFLACRAASTTFAFDPLAEAAASGGFIRPLADIEHGLVTAARSLEWHDRMGAAAIADGRIWNAAGASEAQELTGILGSLSHLVRLLTDAGISPAAAVARIGIALAADAHTILTLAKVRAARLVHARFIEAVGLAPLPTQIHAETSWRMMTRRAPQLNMLRTTSAVLAAGTGGADSIGVLPFSAAAGLPDPFARRLARNSQIILLEESGMARIDDPGAGSGTIETVTEALAAKAWDGFRAIEAAGGLLAALRAGTFQRDIAAMRERRAARIAAGDAAILGVTAFAVREESKAGILAEAPSLMPRPDAKVETIVRTEPMRLAESFEKEP